MAGIEYDHGMTGAPGHGLELGRIINGLGALVSLALIAGLGWWGYHLVMRDVTGVPVIRALEGPMRIAPEDPGGASADYQGLAVNTIPAVGAAEKPADRLVLAPKPTRLTDEDQPENALAALRGTPKPATATAAAEPRAAGAAESTAAASTAMTAGTTGDGTGGVAAEAPAASAGRSDETGASAAADAPAEDLAAVIEATLQQVALAPEPIPASVPGVAKSPLPVPRPHRESASAPAAPEPAAPSVSAAPDGVRTIDPADIPPGTRLVQLGAYDSVARAREEWRAIADRYGAFFAGKARVIEQAQSGGQVFYRLRVHGFADMSEARRFCAALLAGQTNCIPLTTR